MMRRLLCAGVIPALVAASTLAASAQIGGKPATGNPTPGTVQPEPPDLNDRVTLTGCLRPSPTRAAAAPGTHDPATPSDARAVLTDAVRAGRVPQGTGGSPLASSTSSRTYRLEGLDSQFSPFMNTRVEISGEIKPPPSNDARASGAPTLLVEFIQRIAAGC